MIAGSRSTDAWTRRVSRCGCAGKPLTDAPDDEAGALNWARQLWCDAVIEPEQTRGVLALLLDAAGRTPARPSGWGVFRM